MSWAYKHTCCNINLSKWKSGLWPNSWGKWRHFLPYHISFHKPASKHDKGYSEKKDKTITDYTFLNECLATKEWTFFAYLYYILIKIGGTYYYNKKD